MIMNSRQQFIIIFKYQHLKVSIINFRQAVIIGNILFARIFINFNLLLQLCNYAIIAKIY